MLHLKYDSDEIFIRMHKSCGNWRNSFFQFD